VLPRCAGNSYCAALVTVLCFASSVLSKPLAKGCTITNDTFGMCRRYMKCTLGLCVLCVLCRWNPEGVAPPEEHGTSHFCVVDAERNAVSLTSSVRGAAFPVSVGKHAAQLA
jgi:hypothetical protein